MTCYQIVPYESKPVLLTRLDAIMRAKKLEAKLARIGTLKRSYAFRLAAIAATDNRLGKVWS